MEVRFSQSDYAHDTGCPQCVRLKSDEDDDFAMMLSHEFPDSRIERNVLNAMCAC